MEDFDFHRLRSSIPISLYVHIPFCRSKCPYCDFFSLPGQNLQVMERIVRQILAELEFYLDLLKPSEVATVYIGGGTPSLLEPPLLQELLQGVRSFAPSPAEWTVEANPESLTEDFLLICREAGVDRLSLGIQTMTEALLHSLQRPGDRDANLRALDLIAAKWKGRWSADLLVGIPGQSREDLREDLSIVTGARPGHISLYSLVPPEGSDLARRIRPEVQEELWLEGFGILERTGYLNYEIANFAAPIEECLHNLRYWRLEPYLGVGPGAVSTLPGDKGQVWRIHNPETLDAQLRGTEIEQIAPNEFLLETLMMGFRLRRGIDREGFLRRFGSELPEMFPALWDSWRAKGLLKDGGETYALTDGGRMILNRLLLELRQALENMPPVGVRWPGGS